MGDACSYRAEKTNPRAPLALPRRVPRNPPHLGVVAAVSVAVMDGEACGDVLADPLGLGDADPLLVDVTSCAATTRRQTTAARTTTSRIFERTVGGY